MNETESLKSVVNSQDEELFDIQMSLDDMTKERDKYKEKYLYALAETDNVRKRMSAEIDRIKKTSGKEIILDLLPVLDSIENAYTMTNDTTGLEVIYKSITDTLAKYNVEAYGEVGEKFDADLYEAISMSGDEEWDSGTITKIFQRGYKMNGEIIRYGKVIVEQ